MLCSKKYILPVLASVLVACCGSAFAAGNSQTVNVNSVGVDSADKGYVNKKQSHIDFRNQNVHRDTLSAYTTVPKISDYELFAGTVIPGTLITGINSDLPGQVIAQISQNVYDSQTGSYLLIPQGTRILGTYNTNTDYMQVRGEIIWTRMILPNGDSMILPNFGAADNIGQSGLKDKVRSHYARVVWTSILGAAMSAGVASAGKSRGERESEFAEDARAQAANNITGTIDRVVDKNLDIQPTIMIRPGFKFNIIIDKDIVLKPYVG